MEKLGTELSIIGLTIFYTIFVVAIAAAFTKGGTPEKIGAALMVSLFAIQAFAYASIPPQFLNVDMVSFGVDFISLGGMTLIAVYAKRVWPIWAASMQLLSIAAHFARQVQIEIEPFVYSTLKSAPTGAACLLLLLGTISHQIRLKKHGFDPSWINWKVAKKARLGGMI